MANARADPETVEQQRLQFWVCFDAIRELPAELSELAISAATHTELNESADEQ